MDRVSSSSAVQVHASPMDFRHLQLAEGLQPHCQREARARKGRRANICTALYGLFLTAPTLIMQSYSVLQLTPHRTPAAAASAWKLWLLPLVSDTALQPASHAHRQPAGDGPDPMGEPGLCTSESFLYLPKGKYRPAQFLNSRWLYF